MSRRTKALAGILTLVIAGLGLWAVETIGDGTPRTALSASSTVTDTSFITPDDSAEIGSSSSASETSAPGGSSTSTAPDTTTADTTSTDTTNTEATDSEATTTTLAPADDPDGGATAADPVALGEAIELGAWRIGVSAVELDATETVVGFVGFNEPPADDHQYVLVELSGVYIGSSAAEPVFDWALVNGEFEHVPDGLECGVIPASIYDVGVTPPNSQFTANVCFEVASSEVTGGLLMTLGLVDETGRERFFSLR